MPFPLPALNVQGGQTYTVNVGTSSTVGAIVIANESPYSVMASAGAGGQWIVAQTADILACNTSAFNGNVTFTTDNYLSNAASAPSFLLYLTAYAPGEPIRGTYPAPLMRLASGITTNVNSPTTTIEQDLLTPFVYSGLVPSSTPPTQYSATAGIAYLRQSDSSLLRIAYALVVQTLSTPSSTFYHDINPDGTYSIATTHSLQPNYLTIATITTNASGNISSVTDTRVMSTVMLSGMSSNPGAPGVELYNLHVTKDIQCDDVISVQGISKVTGPSSGNGYIFYIGGQDELIMMPTGSTVLQGVVIYGAVSNSPSISLPLFSVGSTFNIGLTWVDVFGQLHSVAPLTLAAGYQETGNIGWGGPGGGAGQNVAITKNFKTVLTNTPTSITFSDLAAPTNASAAAANVFTKYGFNCFWTAPAAGFTGRNMQYVTVGNCLLAVDATQRMFDHHCDQCGHLSQMTPLDAIERVIGPGGQALTYTCPACDARECFNCALSAADEADSSPQGSGEYQTTRGAQATLIRALMRALDIEVAP